MALWSEVPTGAMTEASITPAALVKIRSRKLPELNVKPQIICSQQTRLNLPEEEDTD